MGRTKEVVFGLFHSHVLAAYSHNLLNAFLHRSFQVADSGTVHVVEHNCRTVVGLCRMESYVTDVETNSP